MMNIQIPAQQWHSSKSDHYKQTELSFIHLIPLFLSFVIPSSFVTSFICVVSVTCLIEFKFSQFTKLNHNVSNCTIILMQMYIVHLLC